MNFLKKPLVLLIALLGGLAAFLIDLSGPHIDHRQAIRPAASNTSPPQPELVLQNETLRAEKTATLKKVDSLEAEVRQLRKELATRSENARERAQKKHASERDGVDPDSVPPEETPFAKSVLELAVKAGRLNAQIQLHPEWDIPELQYVDEGEWIHFAKDADLESAEGISKALAELRKTAKSRFADIAREALSSFAKANGGQPPSSLGQLTPYMPDSITPALLDRYQLIPANSPQRPASPDIGGPMILREKAPVDPQYDTSFDIGPVGWSSTSTGMGYFKKQFR